MGAGGTSTLLKVGGALIGTEGLRPFLRGSDPRGLGTSHTHVGGALIGTEELRPFFVYHANLLLYPVNVGGALIGTEGLRLSYVESLHTASLDKVGTALSGAE